MTSTCAGCSRPWRGTAHRRVHRVPEAGERGAAARERRRGSPVQPGTRDRLRGRGVHGAQGPARRAPRRACSPRREPTRPWSGSRTPRLRPIASATRAAWRSACSTRLPTISRPARPGRISCSTAIRSCPRPDPKEFLALLRANEAGGVRRALYFATHFRSTRIVLASRQHHACHLDIHYWSTTPYSFGAGPAVKYMARPALDRVSRLPDQVTDTYLRDALRAHLAQADASFDLMVQFYVDENRTPIEDATVEWTQERSPWQAVARIRIPRQAVDDAGASGAMRADGVQSVARAAGAPSARRHEPGQKRDLPRDERVPPRSRRAGAGSEPGGEGMKRKASAIAVVLAASTYAGRGTAGAGRRRASRGCLRQLLSAKGQAERSERADQGRSGRPPRSAARADGRRSHVPNSWRP